jgi:hypothetical protein
MLTKKKLQETIDKFPERFTVDELIDKIILLDKIDKGNLQSEKGEIISEEELEKQIERWFK